MLHLQIAKDVIQPGFKDVYSMYCSLLTDRKTSLGFKSRALDILAFFAALPNKEMQGLK